MPHRVERSEDKWGFLRVWEPCPFERFQRADLSPWRLEACIHLMWGWLYAWSLSDRPELWSAIIRVMILPKFWCLVCFLSAVLSCTCRIYEFIPFFFMVSVPGIAFPGSCPFRMLSRGLLILFPSRSLSTVEQCWPLLDFPSCWRWKMWAFHCWQSFFFFKL